MVTWKTQAYVDISYGPQGIELLKQGLSPQEIIRMILASDPDPRPSDWPKGARQFLAALEAGQSTGGDTRGMGSVAMIIAKKGGGVWLNNDVVLRLQLGDSPWPVEELRRLVEIAARERISGG